MLAEWVHVALEYADSYLSTIQMTQSTVIDIVKLYQQLIFDLLLYRATTAMPSFIQWLFKGAAAAAVSRRWQGAWFACY